MLQTEAVSKTTRKAQMWEEGLEDLVGGGERTPSLRAAKTVYRLYTPQFMSLVSNIRMPAQLGVRGTTQMRRVLDTPEPHFSPALSLQAMPGPAFPLS